VCFASPLTSDFISTRLASNVNVSSSTNLVIVLGMMQVSKKIPFDNPDVLLGVRVMYAVSNVIILAIYLYVQSVINKKKGIPLSSSGYFDWL
jgi:hypothetical protein